MIRFMSIFTSFEDRAAQVANLNPTFEADFNDSTLAYTFSLISYLTL